ncbi:MAG: GrpB family protein [Anaerolineae bacterium]
MFDYDHLGTPGGCIEIVDYDIRWPMIFEREAERILQACAGVIVAIEHIGSTAVPNLPAKPVLDIMPGVAAYDDGARTIEPLTRLGYLFRGENGIPGRYYFDLRFEERTVIHVHIYQIGTGNWERHLLFRDYLREHADVASQYAALKRDLAMRFRNNRVAYTDAKSEFITAVVARAESERQRQAKGGVRIP